MTKFSGAERATALTQKIRIVKQKTKVVAGIISATVATAKATQLWFFYRSRLFAPPALGVIRQPLQSL